MQAAASALLFIASLATGTAALSQTVGLSGMLGGKALIIVDAAAPKSVAVGDAYKGVRIVSTEGDHATVEIAGRRHTLRVGDAPASVGNPGGNAADGGAGGSRVVLTAGSGGHFLTPGQINGRTVQFMVDTGATQVGMSAADAERIGINYKTGQPIQIGTANGVVPGWLIKVDRASGTMLGYVEVSGSHGLAVAPNGDLLLSPGPGQVPARYRKAP